MRQIEPQFQKAFGAVEMLLLIELVLPTTFCRFIIAEFSMTSGNVYSQTEEIEIFLADQQQNIAFRSLKRLFELELCFRLSIIPLRFSR